MKFLSSLDAKDRRLLLWSVSIAIGLAVLIGFVLPNENNNDNPCPRLISPASTARAPPTNRCCAPATTSSAGSGPLTELAATAGPDTVVIFAEPFTRETDDFKAVARLSSAAAACWPPASGAATCCPAETRARRKNSPSAACQLEPEGLDALANTGEVWMVPEATWQVGNPAQRIQYSCAGQPAVVEYDYGNGHVVWWASSTPLENGSLARAANLDLLLNSIGPREGHHFYWDESLHGDVRSDWSYVAGPSVALLWIGLILVSILVVFSFSRRSGPVRELPPPARATPIEFLEALGSLYRNAGASSTAVTIALERFRRYALRLCGLRQAPMARQNWPPRSARRFPKPTRASKPIWPPAKMRG